MFFYMPDKHLEPNPNSNIVIKVWIHVCLVYMDRMWILLNSSDMEMDMDTLGTLATPAQLPPLLLPIVSVI